MRVAFIVQGTGEPRIQDALRHLSYQYQGRFDTAIEYNEGLAHQIYAGADYLLMPSRIEPCGLNQMYSMRYGTLPIVRAVGGLKDTVPDIGEPDGKGRGIRFTQFSIEDAALAVYRAVEFYYQHNDQFDAVRSKIMQIDFSWERSANAYIQIYEELMD
jgi:starch synthase